MTIPELFNFNHTCLVMLFKMTLTAQTPLTVFADWDVPADFVDSANASPPVHSITSPAALYSPTAAATKTPACPCWQGCSWYSMASSRPVTFAGMVGHVRSAARFWTALRTMECDAQDDHSYVLTRLAPSSAVVGYLLPVVALESDEIWRERRTWSPDVDPSVALDASVGCNCCQRCCCWGVVHCVDAGAFPLGHPWGPEVTWVN